MCSNLYTEEHIFVLQEIHSFIIEHLLCARRGAKTEAITRRRHRQGGGGEAACKCPPRMHCKRAAGGRYEVSGDPEEE